MFKEEESTDMTILKFSKKHIIAVIIISMLLSSTVMDL
jgi:hypothetical protein